MNGLWLCGIGREWMVLDRWRRFRVSLASLLDGRRGSNAAPIRSCCSRRLRPIVSTESDLGTLLASLDPFVFGMTIASLAEQLRRDSGVYDSLVLPKFHDAKTAPRVRLGLFLATRRFDPKRKEMLEPALQSADQELVRAAVQWIGEERIQEFKPQLSAVLEGRAISNDLFLATLAGLELLDGVQPAKDRPDPCVAICFDDRAGRKTFPIVARPGAADPGSGRQGIGCKVARQAALDDRRGTETRDGPDVAGIDVAGSRGDAAYGRGGRDSGRVSLLGRGDCRSRLRAAETPRRKGARSGRSRMRAHSLVRSSSLRTEALRSSRGIAHGGTPSAAVKRLAEKFKDGSVSRTGDERELIDQIRAASSGTSGVTDDSLSGSARPSQTAGWVELLRSGGDPEAGRRIFYHSKSAGCFKCHTIQGRGDGSSAPTFRLWLGLWTGKSWSNRSSSREKKFPLNS